MLLWFHMNMHTRTVEYTDECENDTILKDNLVANGQMLSASHYQLCQLHPPEFGLAMPTVIDQKSSH